MPAAGCIAAAAVQRMQQRCISVIVRCSDTAMTHTDSVLLCFSEHVLFHHGQATQQQQWNPYNTTAAGSSKTRSSCSEQREPDPATAAAAAAAAANSSGLSACALRQRHGSMQLMRGVPGSAAAAATSDSQAEPAAALRAVLLSQYEVALEQFGSLQEALEYLEQQDQQDNLVGLAAEDYNTGHKQRKQHIRRHRQDGMYPGMYSPRAAR
jgi:hypothetical protein